MMTNPIYEVGDWDDDDNANTENTETKSLPLMSDENKRKLLREQEILALRSHVKMLEDIDNSIEAAEEAMSFSKAKPLLVPFMVIWTLRHRTEKISALEELKAKRTEFYENLNEMIVNLANKETTDIRWN